MRFAGTAASFRSQGPERDAEQEDLQRLAVLVAAVGDSLSISHSILGGTDPLLQ